VTNETKQSTPKLAEQLFSLSVLELSCTQETAISLYSLNLNVFPVPYGKKGGWPWRILQYVRLNPEDLHTLFSGRCNIAVMTGRTSGNLFVIDCETKASFEYHLAQMTNAGIPIWAVKTGSSKGGGHFYLRCSSGEVKGYKANDFEIRGNRCYVLAPSSVHPDGGIYDFYQRDTVEPPEVDPSQLAWLALEVTKNSPKQAIPRAFAELAQDTRKFIFSGASEGERNNRLFAAACDLHGNGYSQQTAHELLVGVARRCGLPEREIYATINSAYSQARTPAKPEQQQAVPPNHTKAHLWAEHRQWEGRTGQTDKIVFLACCVRAATANDNGIFRASSREVAEIAHVTRKTASLSLKRLVQLDYLTVCGTDGLSRANLYRLAKKTFATPDIPEKNSRVYPTTSLPFYGLVNGVNVGISELLEHRALGKIASQVYIIMVGLEYPIRAKELSELVHLNQKQVYRALNRLKKFTLVEKVPGGFIAIPQTEEHLAELVTKPTGTLGKSEKRKARHQWERAYLAGGDLYKARFVTIRSAGGGAAAPVPAAAPAAPAPGGTGTEGPVVAAEVGNGTGATAAAPAAPAPGGTGTEGPVVAAEVGNGTGATAAAPAAPAPGGTGTEGPVVAAEVGNGTGTTVAAAPAADGTSTEDSAVAVQPGTGAGGYRWQQRQRRFRRRAVRAQKGQQRQQRFRCRATRVQGG